ncbi:MAG: M20/M25/M40 family metallo-hydrolase [Deltaproteobacteria bacterium]|nr:MAG: M20/M25/M40 family metallo-hydrolase [Deltaproteobacteria bacterium]
MTTVLFLALALAKPPEPQPTPEYVEHWRSQVDWKALGDESVDVLAEYLAVDTVNPPGNEARGAAFLARELAKDRIESKRYVLSEGRESLVARIPGSGDQPPLCLLSHIDVVPAEEERWDQDPLSGARVDGYLYGRGALDMKGMGALELQVLRQLHRQRVPLNRDIVLVAVADEEVDNLGMKQIVEHWDEIGCSHMVNEGGLGIRDALFDGQAVHAISTAEKGVFWVDMIAEGPAGHGSTEDEGEAPGRLLEAMQAVATRKAKPRIEPDMYTLLANIGAHKGGFTGWVLRHRWTVNLLAKGQLMGNSATRATITDTLHLTGMSGANSHNVVPSEVRARYDSRLLPGTTGDEMLAELEHLTRKVDGISFEVFHDQLSNGSPVDDPLFAALSRYAVEGRPYAVAGPVLSVGFTDSIFARPLGVHAYGYVPFEVSEEDANTMHGHNERVSEENVHEGVRRLYSAVVEVSVNPEAREPLPPLPPPPAPEPDKEPRPEDLEGLPEQFAP